MKKLMHTLLIIMVGTTLSSQNDPVLMTIDDQAVKLSEFRYIYEKNNGQEADYSRASVDEYLNLFINFKLKVHKAIEMGMDTIKSLKDELNGYRKQLAESYLMEKELSERLIKQIYERKKQDVLLSHILISNKKNSSPSDLNTAISSAKELREKIRNGADFATIARQFSDDTNSSQNGGEIGWITAWLPNGFYDLENAAYQLKLGTVSEPIVTKLGVHLVKVMKRRPAVGKIEVAHILIRHDSPLTDDPKGKIFKVKEMLDRGQPFDEMAKTLSEDKNSAGKGGRLQPFGINTFEKNFEEAAFALKDAGDYTQPVKTRVGWHIIKLIDKPTESYEDFKQRMKPQLPRLERYEKIKDILVEEVKKEYHFTENRALLDNYIAELDGNFFSYRWKPEIDQPDTPLFSFDDEAVRTLRDFASYLQKNSRSRMRYNKEKEITEAANLIYNEYVRETALELQEKYLENKYPDFAALMREYQEGILLFEVSKMMVWDKAAKDTSGLRAFYENHKDNYVHDGYAMVNSYTIPPQYRDKVEEIYNYALNHNAQEVLDKFNKKNEVIIVEQAEYEKDDEYMKHLSWHEGAASPLKLSSGPKTTTFRIVESITPPSLKSLEDSRGYVIADYQQYLEEKWVTNLKNQYKVELKKAVLDNLIKS